MIEAGVTEGRYIDGVHRKNKILEMVIQTSFITSF